MTTQNPDADTGQPERLDGRVTVTEGEMSKVVALLIEMVTPQWIAMATRNSFGETKKIDYASASNLAQHIFQRVNLTRLGCAEGTVAVNEDGRLARRYYSAAEKRLTWLVIQPPSDSPVEVDSGCELPGPGWTVCRVEPWQVVR